MNARSRTRRCRTARERVASWRSSATTRSRSLISDLVLLDRERCILCARCTRFSDEISGDPLIEFMSRGQRHRGQHLPRPPVLVLFLREHRPALPGGRAHRQPIPVPGPALGPPEVESSSVFMTPPIPGSAIHASQNQILRLRRGGQRRHQSRLAVRQGPFRLPVPRLAGSVSPRPWYNRDGELVEIDMGGGSRPSSPERIESHPGRGRWRRLCRDRRRSWDQRGRLRPLQVRQGGAGHEQRRLPGSTMRSLRISLQPLPIGP